MGTIYPSKDTYIVTSAPTGNYGSLDALTVTTSPSASARGLFHFDVTACSAGDITTLNLYCYVHTYGSGTVQICRLTQTSWVETEATWNIYSTGNNWATSGGDYTTTGAISFTTAAGWNAIDISTLVEDAIASRSDQLHILLKYVTEGIESKSFFLYSKEKTGTTYDPYLNYVTPASKTQSDLVSSVTETIAQSTSSYSYTAANNNQAYVLNTKVGAWSYIDNHPFWNMVFRPSDGTVVGSRRDCGNISTINSGTTFDGTNIATTLQFGYFNFGEFDEIKKMESVASEALKRLRALFTEAIGGGDLTLTVYTEQDTSTGDTFTIDLGTADNAYTNMVRTALSRDIRGKYVSFKVQNASGADVWIGEMKLKVAPRAIR